MDADDLDLSGFFDEGDELGDDTKPADITSPRRRKPVSAPHGNTPRGLIRERRAEVVAQATGRDYQEPAPWRQALRDGKRSRAESALRSTAPTNNSASGFGAARVDREIP